MSVFASVMCRIGEPRYGAFRLFLFEQLCQSFSTVADPFHSSVLDLALSRTQTHEDKCVSGREELGDLRAVSRKGWSRSVDDLGRFPSTQTPSVNTSNIKLSTSPPRDDSTPSPTKARIEAYRKNMSVTPQSLHPHYPFPTIQTTSPSSSAPSPTLSDNGGAVPLAHSRSFSHVPFQSSKLASPSMFITEQPQHPHLRKRTASSFERERERDKDKVVRSGFGFSFSTGGTSSKLNSGPLPVVSLPSSQLPPPPLPTMVETKSESKRTSQIVHYSGFLNRHPDSQPSHRSGQALSAALTKGWKPYKAVLKGSKLYFYKPPSDRIVAVKELFPRGMDPVSEEVSERPETVPEEPETPIRVPVKDKEDLKKRTRLYRGRATHPELNLAEDGIVARGSSDAFIHEAVFGTSFSTSDLSQTEGRWRHFTSAVVLCLPRLMGRAKFECEFIRYASYLISGADDEERGRLHARTLWLAERYLFYQGGPADVQVWNAFRTEVFPSLSPSVTVPPPAINNLSHESPDLETFSPRPPQSQTLSSFASFSAAATPPRPSLSRPSLSQLRSDQTLWLTLEKEGLTSDVFFKLDSIIVARSLVAFHRTLLVRNRDWFLEPDIIGHESHETEDYTAILVDMPYRDFLGSDDNPHWLTRFIVVQVLNIGGTVTLLSNSQSDAMQVSKTHLRSDIINKWVRIGEHCRISGDRCSWKAIEAALCSRPIARLDKVWKRVDGSVFRSFQGWFKVQVNGSSGDPISTPWGGDVRERVTDLVHKLRVEFGGKDEQWDAFSLQEIFKCIEPVAHDFLRSSVDLGMDGTSDDIAPLTQLWQSVHGQPPPKSPSLNDYLSQSLAAEPRQKGRFEPYHWQRHLNAPSIHTLVPLLFADHFPTVTLIDRDHIYRGKKESLDNAGSHPGLDEAQVLRMTRMKSSVDVRRESHEMRFRESNKLLPNSEMGGTVLRMHGGELLLLVPESFLDSGSRPPSSLEISLEKRASQIRVTKPCVARKTSMARRSSLPTLSQRNSISFPDSTFETTFHVVVKAGTLDRLVDILISGFEGVSVAVADDNGEMPLREERTRLLKLDRNEFRATWWSVFRSFVTPIVLFEVCAVT